jgi:hypothetical protein
MKFTALLKKELRESLVPMVLAAVAFALVAGLIIHEFVDRGGNDYADFERHVTSTHMSVLFHYSPLSDTIAILIATSVGLSIALALLHFWTPRLARTWPFLLHRPVSRTTILLSKLSCSLIALSLAVGVPWTLAYLAINHVKVTGFPAQTQTLWEGWVYIALGFACYLGTALAILSTARWYTTRFFGLALVPLVLTAMINQTAIISAFGVMLFGIAMLLVQLFTAFSQKEC